MEGCLEDRKDEERVVRGRAVGRAMKTRDTARAEEKKKTQLDPPRNILYGPGEGLNRRVRGPTRAVAPSSSHIEKLVIHYACGLKKDLKILPPNALREFRCMKSRISGRKGRSCSEDIIVVSMLEEEDN
ncbi:hypothetical protein OUZ56_003360 [Daphnia magna]|uniref:Uncharacterized protein n=1 Tax=Daphnia magna TaxID=35525 RepID=A0ABR0A8W9_9CRUS|nr:hypothetical protein OUZ56_003360 [Daphnia magna]